MAERTSAPLVLHVVRPALGGMRTHIDRLLAHNNASHWNQAVAGPVPAEWAQRLRDLGARVCPVEVPDRLEPLHDLHAVLELRQIISNLQPAVVHCHGSKAALIGRLSVGAARRPVVIYTVHGELLRKGKSRSLQWVKQTVERGLASRTNRFITVSEDVADGIIRRLHLPDNRVSVIPNGVDADEFVLTPEKRLVARQRMRRTLGLPDDAVVVGSLARLAPEKGLDVLVEAIALLPDAPGLVIAGEGPERQRLMELAILRGINDRVSLIGQTQDVVGFLGGLDAFALPSRSEGQSIALLEALAAGVPVAAARTGGIPEVVTHNVHGILVPPENPGALAEALQLVLGTAGASLAESGRKHVAEKFAWSKVIRRLDALYEQALLEVGMPLEQEPVDK